MSVKPALSFRQVWNLSFGFLGIQFAFGLQNADVSRIFETLGADMQHLSILWVAAPLTGLLVQPLIGYASDHTWGRFGRRRPYFLAGAALTALALLAMPRSRTLWMAAMMLWIMDASVNVSMEPFRAFVADQLPSAQRPLGFALQSFFIGLGAVLASILPWLLARLGVANVAPAGAIPETVRIAFYAGAAILVAAVLWTVASTREYPPEQLLAFTDSPKAAGEVDVSRAWVPGYITLVVGLAGAAAIRRFALSPQLYVLAAGLIAAGALYVWLGRTRHRGPVRQVMADLYAMPGPMRRLAWVQFFSWFPMFALWIYTTPVVTSVQFGSSDPLSAAYNAGANWAGVLDGAYNGFAVLAAIVIPLMVRRVGLRVSHLLNLALAALGMISFAWIRNPDWLLLSMVGVGFGWASILSLPYTLLADNLPADKMGVYMGIFNFFIVIPQILAASVLGVLLHVFFGDRPVFALVIGGVSLLIAGLCTLRVDEPGARVAAEVTRPA